MKIKPILISLLASASLGVVVASSMVATFVATKTIETYTLQSLDNDNNLSTVLANSGEKLTLNTINENNRKKSDVVYSIDGDDYQQYLQLKDNVLLCKNTPLATRSYNIIASDANNPSRTIATTKIRIIPSPTSLKIYGNDKIAVQIGAREGSLQYLLDDNTGQSVVGGT
jgi:viroplasmin and RNaseH domain-containing protein